MASENTHTEQPGDPTPVHIAPPQDERLLEVLTSLETQIKKQTSLKFTLIRGAVYGLGTVVGATMLLALFGGIFAAVIQTVDDVPFIGNIVSDESVDGYIE